VSGDAIRLDGLDGEAVVELVGSLAPDAPRQLAERLREHAPGNPLHILGLLREHSAPELAALAARGELPAPAPDGQVHHYVFTVYALSAAHTAGTHITFDKLIAEIAPHVVGATSTIGKFRIPLGS